MKIIKMTRIIMYLFVLLVFLVFMTGFVTENGHLVKLVLFGYVFQSMPLSALLLVVFVIGGCVGVLSGIFMVLKLRIAMARLDRKLKKSEDELKKLRVSTLKGLS